MFVIFNCHVQVLSGHHHITSVAEMQLLKNIRPVTLLSFGSLPKIICCVHTKTEVMAKW